MTEPLFSYTLQKEISIHYVYSRHNLTNKEKLLSKSELNHRFTKAYILKEGLFVLHGKVGVIAKSSRKLPSSKKVPYRNMSRVTDVIYGLLSDQANILFVHRNHSIPFHPVVPHLETHIQPNKTVCFNPHITISLFNPAGEIITAKRTSYDSLENFDNEITSGFILTDNHHTSINSPDEDTSSPLMFDNSQQPPTTPIDQTNTNQN